MNWRERLSVDRDYLHDPARAARGLVRRALRARLSGQAECLVAADLDGSPLLLGPLAGDTGEASVELRYEPETASGPLAPVPCTVSIRGVLHPMREEPSLGRYISRFCWRHGRAPESLPGSERALYRVAVDSVQLGLPSGELRALQATDYVLTDVDSPDHLNREWDNLAHQNYQHLDINEQLVTALLELPAGRWVLTGLDPEGMDFRLEQTFCRIPFANRADSQAEMGTAIKELLREARTRLEIPVAR